MFDKHLSRDKAKRRKPHQRMYRMMSLNQRRPVYLPPIAVDLETPAEEELELRWMSLQIESDLTMLDLTYDGTLCRYTRPQPFVAHQGGGSAVGRKMNMSTRNEVWRAVVKGLREQAKDLRAKGKHEEAAKVEAKYLAEGTLPPLPTFEEQLAKAGGRAITVPNTTEVADWHEMDI